MPLRASPVGTSMFVASIIGFFTSAIYVIKFSETWAVTFAITFALMFVASMISMAHAIPEPQLPERKYRARVR